MDSSEVLKEGFLVKKVSVTTPRALQSVYLYGHCARGVPTLGTIIVCKLSRELASQASLNTILASCDSRGCTLLPQQKDHDSNYMHQSFVCVATKLAS